MAERGTRGMEVKVYQPSGLGMFWNLALENLNEIWDLLFEYLGQAQDAGHQSLCDQVIPHS
jgi:hypothetical protein